MTRPALTAIITTLNEELNIRDCLASVAFADRILVVDIHAEATSEKAAIGWYLDGRVSAVIGTHTHVPTADETIRPGGTAWSGSAWRSGNDGVMGFHAPT